LCISKLCGAWSTAILNSTGTGGTITNVLLPTVDALNTIHKRKINNTLQFKLLGVLVLEVYKHLDVVVTESDVRTISGG